MVREREKKLFQFKAEENVCFNLRKREKGCLSSVRKREKRLFWFRKVRKILFSFTKREKQRKKRSTEFLKKYCIVGSVLKNLSESPEFLVPRWIMIWFRLSIKKYKDITKCLTELLLLF